jgi:hypothetical protein
LPAMAVCQAITWDQDECIASKPATMLRHAAAARAATKTVGASLLAMTRGQSPSSPQAQCLRQQVGCCSLRLARKRDYNALLAQTTHKKARAHGPGFWVLRLRLSAGSG